MAEWWRRFLNRRQRSEEGEENDQVGKVDQVQLFKKSMKHGTWSTLSTWPTFFRGLRAEAAAGHYSERNGTYTSCGNTVRLMGEECDGHEIALRSKS